MTLNIINTNSIDTYLRKFCGDDERLQTFLVSAMSRVIKKHDEAMEILEVIPTDAPDWLIEKWDTREAWHRFDFKKDIFLAGKVYDVVLWLEAAIRYDLKWVHNLDQQGRPKKLMQISSFDHLSDVMSKDERKIAKIRSQDAQYRLENEDLKADFDIVMTFDDGFSIVRLKTKTAIEIEGDFLSHCIGDGRYDYCLSGNVSEFYSLRDDKGLPLATFQIDQDVSRLIQAKGKRNAFPKGELIPYITTFCRELFIDVKDAFSFEEGYELV